MGGGGEVGGSYVMTQNCGYVMCQEKRRWVGGGGEVGRGGVEGEEVGRWAGGRRWLGGGGEMGGRWSRGSGEEKRRG